MTAQIIAWPIIPRPRPRVMSRRAEHFYCSILQASGYSLDEARERAAELVQATLQQNFGEGEFT